MPDAVTRDALAALLDSQITAVLSTESGHQPYANLVAFSFSDDLRKLFFATPRNTTKYRNLVENPRLALVIDSRNNDPEDFSRATAVTALGCGRELTGEARTKPLAHHSRRLPGLAAFLETGSIALFEIEVYKYIITRGLDAASVFIP